MDLPPFGADPYRRLLPLLDERRFSEAVVLARMSLEGPLSPGNRARLHNLLCWTFAEGLRKPSPEAVLHGHTAGELALVAGDLKLATQAHLNSAMARYQQGDLDGAWRDLTRAKGWLAEAPDRVPHGRLICWTGQAEILRTRGEWLAAERYLRRALEHCGAGDDFFAADIHRRMALLRLDQGQPAAALDLVAGLLDGVPYAPHSLWWKTQVLLVTTLALVALGRRAVAQRQVIVLLALARELEDQPAESQALAMMAVLAGPQEQSRATELARQAMNSAVASSRQDVIHRVTELIQPWLNMET